MTWLYFGILNARTLGPLYRERERESGTVQVKRRTRLSNDRLDVQFHWGSLSLHLVSEKVERRKRSMPTCRETDQCLCIWGYHERETHISRAAPHLLSLDDYWCASFVFFLTLCRALHCWLASYASEELASSCRRTKVKLDWGSAACSWPTRAFTAVRSPTWKSTRAAPSSNTLTSPYSVCIWCIFYGTRWRRSHHTSWPSRPFVLSPCPVLSLFYSLLSLCLPWSSSDGLYRRRHLSIMLCSSSC